MTSPACLFTGSHCPLGSRLPSLRLRASLMLKLNIALSRSKYENARFQVSCSEIRSTQALPNNTRSKIHPSKRSGNKCNKQDIDLSTHEVLRKELYPMSSTQPGNRWGQRQQGEWHYARAAVSDLLAGSALAFGSSLSLPAPWPNLALQICLYINSYTDQWLDTPAHARAYEVCVNTCLNWKLLTSS